MHQQHQEEVVSGEQRLSVPQTAREMLIAMAGSYKYELAPFEVLMWTGQVFEKYPDEMVMRALLAHMESGSQDAQFFPKYGAIKAVLEKVGGAADIALAVRRGSPYVAPELQDPVLIEAIQQMGGWAMVCAEMPDPIARPIDHNQYLRRLDAAVSAARNTVQIQGRKPAPLVAIGQQTNASLAAPQRLALAGTVDSGAACASDLPAEDALAETRKLLRPSR